MTLLTGYESMKTAIYCRVSTEGQKQCPKCRSPYWNKPKVKQSVPQREVRNGDS